MLIDDVLIKRSQQFDVTKHKHIKFILIIYNGPAVFNMLITILN